MTHCHREIFHAQWEILLDDEFLAAYEHGILIRCCDGVIRRLYPRIFTYSADYPEKSVAYSFCFPTYHFLGSFWHLFVRGAVLAHVAPLPSLSFHNLVHKLTPCGAHPSLVKITMSRDLTLEQHVVSSIRGILE
jgi:hypothetical protein